MGGFAKPQRRKQRLVLPTELEGTTDRQEWSTKIGDFYRKLYDHEDDEEKERVFRCLVTVGKLARRAPKRRIWFSPEHVRGVIERCPKHSGGN